MAYDEKEYKKRWYKNNRDSILEKHKKWYKDNKNLAQELKSKYNNRNPERVMYSRVKNRAMKYNIPFELEFEDIKIPDKCAILGITILQEYVHGGKKGPRSSSPSLDRIDNTKGYIKGNIQVISNKANIMKNNASPEELVMFALWILKTYKDYI